MSATPAPASDADLAIGEFPFTRAECGKFAQILYAATGIVLDQQKMLLVYSRLAKRLRLLGLESFADYQALLVGPDGGAERQLMVEALTTNVTRFFREPHHFQHLREEVLPGLIAEARDGGRIRLWSAGCSSGEEPYSIAMTLLSLMPDAADHDVKILATDIDTQVLERGRAGLYSQDSVEQVPPILRERWMGREADGRFRMGPAARALVTFRAANLVGAWPMRGPFQVIFCRNVVIYFDDQARDRVLDRMSTRISPGGHVYVGHSERLRSRRDDDFEMVGLSTYRHRAEART